MRQLKFLLVLTACIGWLPVAAVYGLQTAAVALGAQDDALGEYFGLLYLACVALGAYVFVRVFDRP
jgi:hypothetical protein